jgi:hypothetical protein
MERAGAAIAIRESELTAEGLAAQTRELLSGRTRRRNMADAARKLGRPEAAAAIVDDLCAFLGVPADGAAPEGGDTPRSMEEPSTSDETSKADGASLRSASVRRPRVQRAPLRIRAVEFPADIITG